ncbi:CST complex subunit STN1, partial [Lachnellula suecica]
MTSNPPIYPEYCHELSPTLNLWCRLRATDIHALVSRGMFSNGRPLYHYGNHPIKWVRVTGVIVAVDEFYGRRVYTLDDSSGMCIECTCPVPVPAKATVTKPSAAKGLPPTVTKAEGPTVTNPNIPWDNVDVGTVVKIKGGIKEFREQRQVEIIKVEVLGGTALEVKCWDEALVFRREVLGVPWV